MREYALQTRNLTVKLKVWSATTFAAGVELDSTIAGDVLRKGTFKFALHLASLDDCLHPVAPLDEALPTSHCTELGVVSSVELVHDAGNSKWIMSTARSIGISPAAMAGMHSEVELVLSANLDGLDRLGREEYRVEFWNLLRCPGRPYPSRADPKLSPPPETGGAHTPPLRRHAILPTYLMASSAAEPAPPPPPPPGSASTRSGSTPVLFVIPSGVQTIPASRGEDWESEGSNAWIPSGMDPALAFRLVVRLDSSFTRDSKRCKTGFDFPAVVATTISLRDFKANIFDKYTWSSFDAVHFEYFNSPEGRFVPLISEDDLGILFALNASCRFGKICIHVDRGQASSGAGASSGGRASCLSTAAASANSVRRGAPCRSTAAPSVPSASGSQIVRTVDVEDDADIEDQSPQDDEDELMFPELVDRCSKQAMEDQYMEDIAFGARFDDTDDEEKNENDDSLVLADYEGEDLPTIEWNREDPQLAEGTVFQTMMDCRNAITTYCILSKNNYEIKKNEHVHSCPPLGGEPELKTKLAKYQEETSIARGGEEQLDMKTDVKMDVKLDMELDMKISHGRAREEREACARGEEDVWPVQTGDGQSHPASVC
ncbi:hypothetical protein QYE76_063496 [Lolium multiflorum]|uniref:Uncharacterized protein n=1 Tax=Lolium multiflorum TaxID=4521 RepID=A0AAD8W6M1_LOLMU|nr:hypothetical protein QYE76_063496 [Lolium multiflorum]